MIHPKIDPMHLDILKEIGNIGAAHAATSLSLLLDKRIEMHVPKAEMITFNETMNLLGVPDEVVVGIYLRLEGDLEGNMFYVLPIEQANRFIRRLLKNKRFDLRTDVSELGLSAMQEIGNILSGAYLSALSDFLQLKVCSTVPGLAIDMFGAIISLGLIEISRVSDYVIVIHTSISEEGKEDSGMTGRFLLLPSPESFNVIFKALGVR
ncbi:chemotaxis protein CheC [Ureibacillus sp. FSL K6-8385]|uniref:Chemotaxis protein CheC n=1 Tax=Ureibacillus terrenus TaxID=118246 RepID=A0A540V4G8_9BACL|nr:chemotaxis protein CheC [Ureibacillus terrenus]MED3660421.1 chemotaxis protein CheC [Ureibacillus terrenus]MED3762576.1 chemotaxis protein CheC [Ureibacillus terrenus]TQE91639.1 chemotaxis protein CheC [Ureibacillus terrenus]